MDTTKSKNNIGWHANHKSAVSVLCVILNFTMTEDHDSDKLLLSVQTPATPEENRQKLL